MGRLDGKVALITGAGSGMGRVATQAFVREGARVVAADVNDKAVHDTVANLDGQAVAVLGDVTPDADVAGLFEAAPPPLGESGRRLYNPRPLRRDAVFLRTTTDPRSGRA